MFSLNDILYPDDPDLFFKTVFGHRLHLNNGPATRYMSLCSLDRLKDMIRWRPVDALGLKLARSGTIIPADAYTEVARRHPRAAVRRLLDPVALEEQLDQGATLVLNHLDEIDSSVARFASDLETITHAPVIVNAYVSHRAEPGFDPHWDDHHVLVLQIEGRKRWTFYGPSASRPWPTYRDIALHQEMPSKPMAECELKPGDILHVPRGWWHEVCALEEPTLHLTAGITPHTGADLMAWFAEQLHDLEIFRADVSDKTPEDAAHYLQTLKAAVDTEWNSGLLDRFRAQRDVPPRKVL